MGKKDYSWISVAKRRKNGGLGFLAKKEVKAEDLKLNEDNIWLEDSSSCSGVCFWSL